MVLWRMTFSEMQQPIWSSIRTCFNTCRVPQNPEDCLVRFDAASHRHIAVIRNGAIFKLKYEHDGQRLDEAQLKFAIDSILKGDLGPTLKAGALTTTERDTWAEVR